MLIGSKFSSPCSETRVIAHVCVHTRDVQMGVLHPQYFQICQKAGQKSAMLQESWPKKLCDLFLFSVIIVGQLVRMPPPYGECPGHINGPHTCKISSTSQKLPVPTSLSTVQSHMPKRSFAVTTTALVTVTFYFHNSGVSYMRHLTYFINKKL